MSSRYAAPAAAEKQWTVKGTIQAVETCDLNLENLTMLVNAHGSGNATHLGRFTYEFQAMGVFVSLGGSGTITDNDISGWDVGVYQVASPNCCRISENTLTNNRLFGIVIESGDGTTYENTIRGGEVGIGGVAGQFDITAVLHADNITGTTVAPVSKIECCGFTAIAIIKDD